MGSTRVDIEGYLQAVNLREILIDVGLPGCLPLIAGPSWFIWSDDQLETAAPRLEPSMAVLLVAVAHLRADVVYAAYGHPSIEDKFLAVDWQPGDPRLVLARLVPSDQIDDDLFGALGWWEDEYGPGFRILGPGPVDHGS